MLRSLANAWKVLELRQRLMLTAALIAALRLGAYVPLPGISREALATGLQTGHSGHPTCTDNAITGLFELLSGGAFSNLSVFSLGIIPYTTAAIVMQMMTVAIPRLQELAKGGETGQQKITQYTRYFTLVLAFIQAIAMVGFLRSEPAGGVLAASSLVDKFLIIVTLTTGGMLTMWIGELISYRGLGNGVSVILTVSILSQAPSAILKLLEDGNVRNMVILGLLAVLIVAAIVFVNEGQRRIPITYAKHEVGRRMSRGGETYLPLKVNMAGEIPITFASTLLIFPGILGLLFAGCNQDSIPWRLAAFFSPGNAPYLILYPMLVFVLTYFYTAVQFNPIEYAENIQKSGAYVPGLRPGMPTAVYLNNVLTRTTLFGAVFLAAVAVLPYMITGIMNLPKSIFLGGTSMLLVVAISLGTARQIESELAGRSYQGFLRKRSE